MEENVNVIQTYLWNQTNILLMCCADVCTRNNRSVAAFWLCDGG